MSLDIKTLVFSAAAVYVLLSISSVFAFNRSYRTGAEYWSGGMATMAVGLLLIVLRRKISSYFSIVFGNAFLLCGISLFSVALSVYAERSYPLKLFGSLLGIFILAFHLLLDESFLVLRVILFSLLLTFFCGYSIFILHKTKGNSRVLLRYLLIFFFGLMILMSALRALFFFLAGREASSVFEPALVNQAFFLFTLIDPIGLTFGFILMVNRRLQNELEHLSIQDPLTGLFNRRAFDALLKQEMARCARGEGPFTLCIIDLDNFKKINDNYGHQAGDAVLKNFSGILRDYMRTEDQYFRFGGDEFCLIFPDSSIEQTRRIMERLRSAIQEEGGLDFEGKRISYSITAGIARFKMEDTESSLQARADAALYAGKTSGRDTIVRETDLV